MTKTKQLKFTASQTVSPSRNSLAQDNVQCTCTWNRMVPFSAVVLRKNHHRLYSLIVHNVMLVQLTPQVHAAVATDRNGNNVVPLQCGTCA